MLQNFPEESERRVRELALGVERERVTSANRKIEEYNQRILMVEEQIRESLPKNQSDRKPRPNIQKDIDTISVVTENVDNENKQLMRRNADL